MTTREVTDQEKPVNKSDQANKPVVPVLLTEAEQKKADLKSRKDFELHVSLIVRTDNVATGVARWRAWCEGPKGLDKRLNPNAS